MKTTTKPHSGAKSTPKSQGKSLLQRVEQANSKLSPKDQQARSAEVGRLLEPHERRK
ncbi:hypothetical protein ACAW74_18060 [Fibrella sp. WM1]|uniref:hypothetical protein n=1 Tax=Fibrella musci TaxID=3242485 RepID=UPI00351FCE2C